VSIEVTATLNCVFEFPFAYGVVNGFGKPSFFNTKTSEPTRSGTPAAAGIICGFSLVDPDLSPSRWLTPDV
jgi:hypothetical protein